MGAGDASRFTRKSAKVGSLAIPYLVGGRGKPLVYLHGLSGWGRWESHHLALAVANTVYAPALPGWPDARVPAEIASVSDCADVMSTWLEAIGLTQFDLVAHSFGGWLALYLATRSPERVSRLILVDTLGVESPDAPATDLSALDEQAFLQTAFAHPETRLLPSDFGAVVESIRDSQEFKRQWRGCAIVAAMVGRRHYDPELLKRLGEIKAETLVVWGREDNLASWRHGALIANAIPGAKLALIADAGHGPMREKRETFNRLVHEFMIGQLSRIDDDSSVSIQNSAGGAR